MTHNNTARQNTAIGELKDCTAYNWYSRERVDIQDSVTRQAIKLLIL